MGCNTRSIDSYAYGGWLRNPVVYPIIYRVSGGKHFKHPMILLGFQHLSTIRLVMQIGFRHMPSTVCLAELSYHSTGVAGDGRCNSGWWLSQKNPSEK